MTEVINTAPLTDGTTPEKQLRFERLQQVTGNIAPDLVAAMADLGTMQMVDSFIDFQNDYKKHRDAADLVGGKNIVMERIEDLSDNEGTFVAFARLAYWRWEDGSGEYYINGRKWDVSERWPGLKEAVGLYAALRFDDTAYYKNSSSTNVLTREIYGSRSQYLEEKMKESAEAHTIAELSRLFRDLKDQEQPSESNQIMVLMLKKMGYNLNSLEAQINSLNTASQESEKVRRSTLQEILH